MIGSEREREKRQNDASKAERRRFLYRAWRLYLPSAPRQNFQTRVRHQPKKPTGFWGRGAPRKKRKIGGIARFARIQSSASSLRECQLRRKSYESKRTVSAAEGRPWSRGEGGGRAPYRFMGRVPLHLRVFLHFSYSAHRAEHADSKLIQYTRQYVTRDGTRVDGAVAGKGRKSRTWRDHAGSPFRRP